MKLFYTETSPFVRKVLVAARELDVQLTTEFLRPSPLQPDPSLSRHNPLSKIPALVLDDGTTLYDSAVICDYLDGDARLVPRSGPERWRVLRVQALCDGILEAGIAAFYERVHRPPDVQWQPWIAGQLAKVEQGLDALEVEAGRWGEVDLGQIAAGCAIAWLEFRKVTDVRTGRATLSAWYEGFVARPSMQATLPR